MGVNVLYRESSRLKHCVLWAWWWVSRLTASVDWIVVICSSEPSAIGGFRVIWDKSDLHSCLGGSPCVGVYSVVTNLHWRGAGVEANLNVVTAFAILIVQVYLWELQVHSVPLHCLQLPHNHFTGWVVLLALGDWTDVAQVAAQVPPVCLAKLLQHNLFFFALCTLPRNHSMTAGNEVIYATEDVDSVTHICTEQCLTPSPSLTPTPLFHAPSMLQPVT